jgi:hypothetical protein
MSEPKFEIVDSEGKSSQEIEKNLLENHKKENEDVVVDKVEDVVIDKVEDVVADKVEKPAIDDDSVLAYLNKKYEREDLTYDSLFKVEERKVEVIKEVEKELPSDLAALLKYRKETGRGLKDYLKSTVDITSMSDDDIIAADISNKNPEFDSDDVRFEMKRLFGVDDMDDESDVREKTIAKKRRLGEAKNNLSDHYEKYKSPLESSDGFFSKEDRDLLKKAKSEQLSQKDASDLSVKKKEYFSAKTNELFSDKFKGFEFTVGENVSKSFEVEDVAKTKENQMSALNFVNSHLDENGMLKDAKKYHKALYAATHTDKLVKWAYELGASEAVESDAKEAKNIDMGKGKKPVAHNKDGINVIQVDNSGSNIRPDGGLRIMGKNN